jgi:hypothetical protein
MTEHETHTEPEATTAAGGRVEALVMRMLTRSFAIHCVAQGILFYFVFGVDTLPELVLAALACIGWFGWSFESA